MGYKFSDPRRLQYLDGGGITPTEIPESEVRWGRSVPGHEAGVAWGQLHVARHSGDDTPYVRSRSGSAWAFPISFEESWGLSLNGCGGPYGSWPRGEPARADRPAAS